jgi:histidinol dehydrogenase
VKIIQGLQDTLNFVETLEARMPSAVSPVWGRVQDIVEGVRTGGREAVLKLRSQFEGVSETFPLLLDAAARRASQFPSDVSPDVSPEVVSALRESIVRVRRYHEIQREDTKLLREGNSYFGSRVRPLDSVALYVPGGTAFYPSSLIMTAVPAQVAGVQRIGVFTPARSLSNPVFLKTLELLGLEHVVAVGGAQAVAMAAFGVEGSLRYDKMVGPGNIYVATAKQMLAGRMAIDGFAGPSEVLVISDGKGNPDWIAADLLAQAEHDAEASSVLLTTDLAEAHAVVAAVKKWLPHLKEREKTAQESLARWGAVCVLVSRDEVVKVANAMATEHLHIQTQCAETQEGQTFWQEAISSAGAIFLGRHCAEVFGDYIAGPSHVLPTAGTARFASPLGVYDFLKRSSLLHMTAEKAQELAHLTKVFAKEEGLPGHALAAHMRSKAKEGGAR